MTKNKTQNIMPRRYKIYGAGISTLSVCSIALGFTAGMWGVPAMIVLGGVMVLVGALGVRFYRRKLPAPIDVTKIEDTQRELIDDINQMRALEKVVSVSNVANPISVKNAKNSSILNAVKRDDDTVTYSEAVTEELILDAINQQSVDVFMQPIVRLPHRRTEMMEVFARLRAGNGQSLSAGQYMNIAKRKNLQVRLDNLLLRQGLKTIQQDVKQGIKRIYMLNIEETTLTDTRFMADLLTFLKSDSRLALRLVFEINQASLIHMNKNVRDVLQALSKIGCRVSIDQVESPQIDRDLTRQIGVRYIKISGSRLKDFAMSDEGLQVMRRIKSSLAQDRVSLIADKIEDERTLCEVLDLEIDYGQGYLFGKPDRESVYVAKNTKRTA